MNTKRGLLILPPGRLYGFLPLLFSLVAAGGLVAAPPEITVPVLHVGPDYFTNATLSPQSSTHVTVFHSRGMTMAKIEDLDPDLQRKLGYEPKEELRKSSPVPTAEPPAGADSKRVADTKQTIASAKLRLLLEKARVRAQEQAEDARVNDDINRTSIIQQIIRFGMLLAITVVYFLFCHACLQLCRRAGTPSTALVWLPGFKKLALFRATGVSWNWFFWGLILPTIGLIGWIICCSRLCQTFQRTRWWTLLMIWPMLGWPIFLFFAYTSRADDDEPAIRNIKAGYAF